MLAPFVGVTVTPFDRVKFTLVLGVKFVLIIGVTMTFKTMHVYIQKLTVCTVTRYLHQIYSMQCTHKTCSIQLCDTNNQREGMHILHCKF